MSTVKGKDGWYLAVTDPYNSEIHLALPGGTKYFLT